VAAQVRNILAEMGRVVANWSAQRQVAALVSLVGGALVFVLILSWATKQNLVPLMTGLSAEDAASIVERLDSDHVPYKLAAQGSAILVPEEKVYDIRLKLAGEGLPRGGNVGFELFDSPSFGMSRFAEQLNYRRGLEGELRRSIRQLDAVREARVHIVVPEQGLFREQDSQATAAVTLHMQPGRVLGKSQVQAIVHLVSSSVAGLSPDHVTVVDSTGAILAKGGDSGGNLSGGLEQQKAIEQGIEERVQAILAPIVGAGHVVVRASALLDFARTEKTTETYDPASAVLRSEQTSEEKRAGGGAGGPASGIPGARSNLSGVDKEASAAPAAQGSNSERRSQTHNFEVNKVMQHEVGASGRLARLSVAVLVDGVSVVAANGDKSMRERTPEELERFADLVRRAVGFDADRDDQVVVQSMAFDVPAALETPPEPNKYLGYVERFWPPVLALLGGIVAAIILLRRRPRGDGQQVFESPRTVREMEAALMGGLGQGTGMPGMPSLAAAGGAGQVPMPALAAGARAGAGINEMAQVEPKRAASVLKSWLSED
jgi:flagellar M-ring protein FliF